MRLIDADEVIAALSIFRDTEHGNKHFLCGIASAKEIVENSETVDAAVVRHGAWLDFANDFSTAECDQCSEIYEVSPYEESCKEYFDVFKQLYNYCPNCGAKMDGEDDKK